MHHHAEKFEGQLLTSTTVQPIEIPSLGSTIPGLLSGSTSSQKGAIAGGIVGGLAGLALLGGIAFWVFQRSKRQKDEIIYDVRARPILDISESTVSRWDATTVTDETLAYSNNYHLERQYGFPKGMAVSRVRSRASGSGSGSGADSNGDSSSSRVLLAKQEMVNHELRGEVDNLRRDLDRIREERTAAPDEQGAGGSRIDDDRDLPPPQYSDPRYSDFA